MWKIMWKRGHGGGFVPNVTLNQGRQIGCQRFCEGGDGVGGRDAEVGT